jgi:antitoxin component YwqK of YwqJK toxin-antitoxin module
VNGQKRGEGNYKDGKRDGFWTFWDENGNITKTETYSNGELVKQ